MHIIALITARGGSKGLPRKNILPVGGKPLIAWTIQAALQSQAIKRVIVSTDDPEIMTVCREWGAEVPFQRPAELAEDTSDHVSVVLHTLDWLKEHGSQPDYILLLQPTSPLRSSADLDGAIQLAQDEQAQAVVSVAEAPSHPYLTQAIRPDGTLQPFLQTDIAYLRRQDLPPAYVLNGAIYLIRPDVLREQKTFLPHPTHAYLMAAERSLDIDTAWDLHLLDLILKDGASHENGSNR